MIDIRVLQILFFMIIQMSLLSLVYILLGITFNPVFAQYQQCINFALLAILIIINNNMIIRQNSLCTFELILYRQYGIE